MLVFIVRFISSLINFSSVYVYRPCMYVCRAVCDMFTDLDLNFLARDSIIIWHAIARYMLSPVRPSVCHTGGSVKNA